MKQTRSLSLSHRAFSLRLGEDGVGAVSKRRRCSQGGRRTEVVGSSWKRKVLPTKKGEDTSGRENNMTKAQRPQ